MTGRDYSRRVRRLEVGLGERGECTCRVIAIFDQDDPKLQERRRDRTAMQDAGRQIDTMTHLTRPEMELEADYA